MAVALSDYRALTRTPRTLAPMLASALGRFPVAMVGLAELLYLQRATGSFAAAGFVAAAGVAGVSVGSVVQGRIIDRFGPTRPLLVAAGLFGVALGALVLAVERGVAVAPLAALTAAMESAGPSAAFLAGGAGGLVLALVLWLRRGTLAPPPVATVATAVCR